MEGLHASSRLGTLNWWMVISFAAEDSGKIHYSSTPTRSCCPCLHCYTVSNCVQRGLGRNPADDFANYFQGYASFLWQMVIFMCKQLKFHEATDSYVMNAGTPAVIIMCLYFPFSFFLLLSFPLWLSLLHQYDIHAWEMNKVASFRDSANYAPFLLTANWVPQALWPTSSAKSSSL